MSSTVELVPTLISPGKLNIGSDYDTKGNITPDASEGRAKAWTQRSLDAGSKATTRRDRVIAEINDREKLVRELERRNEEKSEPASKSSSEQPQQSSPQTEPTTEE